MVCPRVLSAQNPEQAERFFPPSTVLKRFWCDGKLNQFPARKLAWDRNQSLVRQLTVAVQQLHDGEDEEPETQHRGETKRSFPCPSS